MGLEEVLDFSRHRDVKVLMVYRDRERASTVCQALQDRWASTSESAATRWASRISLVHLSERIRC
jgi:hypothetical protein